VQLANDKLMALIAPHRGGQIYELDVRSICHNLLATFTRRPEPYHRKVLAGANPSGNGCASIHDRVVFKQEGLDQRIQYDTHLRKSLIDLFYENDATLSAVASGQAPQRGDFAQAVYEARLRRNPDRIQVQLSRDGNALDVPLRITKAITLGAGSSMLEIAYLLENLPADRPLHFAVELNFAGMPAGADDRYFYDLEHRRLGQLGARLDLVDALGLGLADEWLGLDVSLKTSRPTGLWTFPLETVSQSESGFELVHQSVVVQPHWIVVPDAEGCWSVTMRLAIDTSRAEPRHSERPALATAT
jgi:alpha-amylase